MCRGLASGAGEVSRQMATPNKRQEREKAHMHSLTTHPAHHRPRAPSQTKVCLGPGPLLADPVLGATTATPLRTLWRRAVQKKKASDKFSDGGGEICRLSAGATISIGNFWLRP